MERMTYQEWTVILLSGILLISAIALGLSLDEETTEANRLVEQAVRVP